MFLDVDFLCDWQVSNGVSVAKQLLADFLRFREIKSCVYASVS